jgi:two-component system nitrogen regulation sensor histidine kinase GlnL
MQDSGYLSFSDEVGLDFASSADMLAEECPVSNEYTRRVLDALTVAVVVLDRDLRLVFMNPAAEMLFALSFRQARGAAFQDLATGTEALSAGLRLCLSSGHPYTERELPLLLPGEGPITVDCTVSALWDQDSGPAELLVEMRQVDRQLRIHREEHLIAQHNTVRALLRNLAHEVKNPLGGLRGAAQLLEREFNDDALKEYTRIIIREADRLRNLVDRMLVPAQLPARGPVNIHEVLERVRSLVQVEGEHGVRIERDYDPSIPALLGDADQLIQAVLNIVRNAVQALDQQGVITLRTRVKRQYTIGHQRHKLVVCVDIIDNGPGIPKELLQQIFYPMISGRADGTGLGLSIAQTLVNQHGGLVECSSRPGETVFTLLLPLERCDGQKGKCLGD